MPLEVCFLLGAVAPRTARGATRVNRRIGAMQSELIEVMRNQVSAIYWAVTGNDMPQAEPNAVEGQPPAESAGIEEVAQRFVELEAMARAVPDVAEHVPPFSFSPLIDAVEDAGALLIE